LLAKNAKKEFSMIVNFNPSVSKKMNTPKLAKNNNPNVAFQRNFTPQEIEGLTKGKANVINNVMVFIGAGLIKAQDGALQTLEKLLEKDPKNPGLSFVKANFN
jgi:hypothetical protein